VSGLPDRTNQDSDLEHVQLTGATECSLRAATTAEESALESRPDRRLGARSPWPSPSRSVIPDRQPGAT